MSRNLLLNQAHEKLEKLSESKILEVIDFAEFLISKTEASTQNNMLLKMAASSQSFNFVNEDEVEYTLSDINKNL